MHDRYPAPMAERLWSRENQSHQMKIITDAYTVARMGEVSEGDLDPDDVRLIREAAPVGLDRWEYFERIRGHEIVGFLEAYLEGLPKRFHRYVHYRLTSSDLVEYFNHSNLITHAREMNHLLGSLRDTLDHISGTNHRAKHPRAGRTHGQTAEATNLWHQLKVLVLPVERVRLHIEDFASNTKNHVIKTPGPTGTSPADVSGAMEYLATVGDFKPLCSVYSTQILPRDYLLDWASLYLRAVTAIEQIAMFVRLGSRSEIGEFQEGRADDRVGSSAMPGKKNPILAERLCGLSRVARGYFLAISEAYTVWEDRDLSNSSTERIAVYGLARITEYMVGAAVDLMSNLVIDWDQISEGAKNPRTRVNEEQALLQDTLDVGPVRASEIASEMRNK